MRRRSGLPLLLLGALLASAGCQSGTHTTRAPSGRFSVLVLPVRVEEAGPDGGHLAPGLAGELIGALGRQRSARAGIIGPHTTRALAGTPGAAAATGAHYLVEMTVQRDSETLDLAVRVSEAGGGDRVWSGERRCDLFEVPGVFDEVAGEIIFALTGERLAASDPDSRAHTTPFSMVYEMCLKARHEMQGGTPEAREEAHLLYQRAMGMDPDYARPFAGMALCRGLQGEDPAEPKPPTPEHTMAKARARRALTADPFLPEAHALAALGRLRVDLEWEPARTGYRAAIELDPSYAQARIWLSELEAARRDFDAAIAQADTALWLEPLWPAAHLNLGLRLHEAGRPEEAIAPFERAIALDPEYWPAHVGLGRNYTQLGHHDEALAALDEAVALSLGSAAALGAYGHALAVAGRTDEALHTLAELMEYSTSSFISGYHLALIQAGLGDVKNALLHLRLAYADRSLHLVGIAVDPRLAGLHSDPRFQKILQDTGLTP